jgi:hypothetical protein
MAISLGFGVMFATVITLLVVPSAYLIVEDVRSLVSRGSREVSHALHPDDPDEPDPDS